MIDKKSSVLERVYLVRLMILLFCVENGDWKFGEVGVGVVFFDLFCCLFFMLRVDML